jgi:hypothetical protein
MPFPRQMTLSGGGYTKPIGSGSAGLGYPGLTRRGQRGHIRPHRRVCFANLNNSRLLYRRDRAAT